MIDNFPRARSVIEWRKVVDINEYLSRPYVVVDPFDSTGLLYLNHDEYRKLVTSSLTAGSSLLVVARPGMEELLRSIQAPLPEGPGEATPSDS